MVAAFGVEGALVPAIGDVEPGTVSMWPQYGHLPRLPARSTPAFNTLAHPVQLQRTAVGRATGASEPSTPAAAFGPTSHPGPGLSSQATYHTLQQWGQVTAT